MKTIECKLESIAGSDMLVGSIKIDGQYIVASPTTLPHDLTKNEKAICEAFMKVIKDHT